MAVIIDDKIRLYPYREYYYSENYFDYSYTEYSYNGVSLVKTEVYDEIVYKLLHEYNLNKEIMTADDFNSYGMDFYEKGLFNEAVLMFSHALKLNNEHVLATYNLACIKSILLPEDDRGDDYTVSEIADLLRRSIELDFSRRNRALEDPDFDNFRSLYPKLWNIVLTSDEHKEIQVVEAGYVGCFMGGPHMNSYFAFAEDDFEWEKNREIYTGKEFLFDYDAGFGPFLKFICDDEKLNTLEDKFEYGEKIKIEYVDSYNLVDYDHYGSSDAWHITYFLKAISIIEIE